MGSVMAKVVQGSQVVGVLILILCTTAWAMLSNNPVLLNAVTLSSSTINSNAIDASHITQGSLQISANATTVSGTLSLQASNDPIPPTVAGSLYVPVNWSTVVSSSAVALGATTSIPTTNLSYRWLRAQWVNTGSSTAKITVNGNFQGY